MMKKTIAIAVLIATAFGTKAQNIEIKTNPFGMAAGAYNITGEYALPGLGNSTLLASAWFNTQDFQDWFWTDRDGGFSVGYRQYFNPREDKGVFLGLTSRYILNSYSYSNGYYDQNGYWVSTGGATVSDDYLSIGFVGGYKYVYNDKISVEGFLGMGRIAFEEIQNSWAHAQFIGGFNFGYRF
jgi:hypothetical protein